jgi:hypothetical protein
MLRLVQLLTAAITLSAALGMAQPTLSESEVRKAEQVMADWLAHPLEFGTRPKRVKYLRSVPTKLVGSPGETLVHLVEYEMPNGTYGRGFVNPVTWSFLGPIPYDKLTDIQLVTAYSGWLWLFPAVQDGRATADFEPGTQSTLLRVLEDEGVTDVVVVVRYKVGTSEFFEFIGKRNGSKVKGAGSAGSKIIFDAMAPQASLPVVYTYLGMVMRGEI